MEKSILRLGLFVLPVGQFWLPLLAALFAVAAARLKCARQRNYLIHVSPFCQDFYLHCRACVSLCVSVCVSVDCLKQITCWLHICMPALQIFGLSNSLPLQQLKI